MKGKLIMLIALLSLFVVSFASALPLAIDNVKINGDVVVMGDSHNFVVEKGDTLDIKVRLRSSEDIKDADLFVMLNGYKYGMIADSQDKLVLGANRTKSYSFELTIPMDYDRDTVDLKVLASPRNGASDEFLYPLVVDGVESKSAVRINEVYLNTKQVEAGTGFTSTVVVENYGDEDLDDVKLHVAVKGLPFSDYVDMDDLSADEEESFDQVAINIPFDAAPGVYDVVFTVAFDNNHYTDSVTKQIFVTAPKCYDDYCSTESNKGSDVADDAKTNIAIAGIKDVKIGTVGAAYPILIQNAANTQQVYTVSVSGIDAWGTSTIEGGSQIVVPAGASKQVSLFVTANEGANPGVYPVTVTISNGDSSVTKQVTANVVAAAPESTGFNMQKALEIGLIILVVIIILLGLIIAFNKLKDNDDKDDEETQTYY